MTFYVVEHVDGSFSVQDRAMGGGVLLAVDFDPKNKKEAELVCKAANEALSLNHLLNAERT